MATNSHKKRNIGKTCLWCHYTRDESDIEPYWACPKCEKAYNKIPAHMQRFYSAQSNSEPWVIKSTPLYKRFAEKIIAVLFLMILLTFHVFTNWQYISPDLDSESYTLVVSIFTFIIVFGDVLTRSHHKIFPLRTGWEVFARKNKKEEELIIKHLPRLVSLIGWGLLLWFVFFQA